MKFGITYNTYNTGYHGVDRDNMAVVARHAEDCGFESFYVSEHIVLYPGRRQAPWSFRPHSRSPTRWKA